MPSIKFWRIKQCIQTQIKRKQASKNIFSVLRQRSKIKQKIGLENKQSGIGVKNMKNYSINDLDDFTESYILCMLWAEDDENGDALNLSWKMSDFSDESLETIIEECKAFQQENKQLLDQAYNLYNVAEYSPESMAGHDYWLTRNGHGVGFWDRNLGDVGEQLTKACQYQPRHIYENGNCLEYCKG